jgi:hypothetical protein
MPTTDNLKITISNADLTKINEAITMLETLLKPLLVTLTGKEIQRLAKASDGTLPFIQQALNLAEQQPQFAPGYLNIPGLRLDLAAWEQLSSIQRRLQPLAADLNSTAAKLGSEAYVTALVYYNAAQEAARRGVSGAQPVVDTLKARFEQNSTKKAAPKS